MGKATGISQSTQNAETANANALTQIAQQQAGRSDQLYQESNPGFLAAENFYGGIASGDPGKIALATAPATQQIAKASAGAKQNIMNNAPAGGEKNLALEQVDVNQGAEVGKVTSGSFINSFNALASLAGQGTGESMSSASNAISGFGASNQGWGQIGQQQLENYQIQQQQFGGMLGALSSLGSGIAGAAGDAGSFAALFA